MSDDTTGTGEGTATTDADTTSTTDATEGKTPQYEGAFDKERHERALAAARDAERKAKERAKAADDRLAAMLQAAGLTQDGKTDPAEQLKELTTRAEAAEAKARQADIRDAVRSASTKQKADADALLDSTSFMAKLTDLDTGAADFGDKVAAAVKDAVKANPARYATAPAGPAKQGADHSGSGTATVTQKQFDAMSMAQRSELYRTNPSLYKQLAG